MRRFLHRLPALSAISRSILSGTLTVWAFLLVSYVLLSCAYTKLPRIDLRLSTCISAYPLLILMCLTLGIVGALLIDLYIKSDPDK